MTVTESTTIYEILIQDQGTAPIFLGLGMHCLGCPSARNETVGQAAIKHGVDPADLVAQLNSYFEAKA